jgi:hypothetical protein
LAVALWEARAVALKCLELAPEVENGDLTRENDDFMGFN